MTKNFIICIAIFILIYLYLENYNLESFENNPGSIQTVPTVYIVWNDKFNIQGLGDKLRGTIGIYQYCQANGIPCVFDARFSVFGKFLANSSPQNPNPAITQSTPVHQLLNVYDDPNALGKFISKHISQTKDNYVCLSTNLFPQVPLTLSDMEFLKWVMEPSPKLKSLINSVYKSIPPSHTIQHFRFEDKKEPDDDLCAKCLELLELSYKPTDMLMTNSNKFKDWVKLHFPKIYTLDYHQSDKSDKINLHVGLNPSDSVIEFTLLEYNLIIKASQIKTYSQYPWVSAFVYWPAQFYLIPITNTKI